MDFLDSLAKAVSSEADRAELAQFVGDHLIVEDGRLTIEYQDSVLPERSFIHLEAEKTVLGYGNKFRQTRLEITQENAWFVFPTGDRVALSDLALIAQMTLRPSA